MIHALAVLERNLNTAMGNHNYSISEASALEETSTHRYKNTEDTYNLLDVDADEFDLESQSLGKISFMAMILALPDIEMRVLALGLYIGLSQSEIADILQHHRSQVTRLRRKMVSYMQSPEYLQRTSGK